ncbi:hypothetical protein ACSTI2_00055, partial [Vibrio parahaemolyticus]
GLPANPTPQQFADWVVNLGSAVDTLVAKINSKLPTPLVGPQYILSGLNDRTQDYAAFGQGEWFFTRQWSVLMGL